MLNIVDVDREDIIVIRMMIKLDHLRSSCKEKEIKEELRLRSRQKLSINVLLSQIEGHSNVLVIIR